MRRSRIRTMTLAALLTAGLLTPVGSGAVAAAPPCDYPAQQLNLTNWKVTLPTGSSGRPTEIKQPQLATYAVAPWFTVNPACTGIQFRAAVNGVTTSGSSYPRSELREMTNNGSQNASWSATSGTHTMNFRLAFKGLPNDKPHIVGAQIHNGSDDVTVFRLEGSSLWITNGNTKHKLITSSYTLNTVFEGRFVVSGGQIRVYYNGTLQTTLPYTGSGNYFKVGAYTQANCSNSSPCSSSNYGESHLYQLQVTHS
jgi:hypothetical protein